MDNLVFLAKFEDQLIGLTFSIGRLVFDCVDMNQVFFVVASTNLAVFGVGLCYWRTLRLRDMLYLGETLLIRVIDLFLKA